MKLLVSAIYLSMVTVSLFLPLSSAFGFWIDSKTIPLSEWVTAPPANGSAENAKDTNTLLDYQKNRGEQECKRANSEVKSTLATFFGAPYGSLKEEEIKRLAPFFAEIKLQTTEIVHLEKAYWKRKRPFVEDHNLKPCVMKEGGESYPSGHATLARLFAETLAVIDPRHADAFRARADQIGLDRVIAGMHHPTDIEAGKKLALRIFSELRKNDRFMKSLEALAQGKK